MEDVRVEVQEEITLNVYEEDMETIKKKCVANMVKIPFGLVRKFMKLFNVDALEDTAQIMEIIMNSWDEVVKLLDRIFPEVEENDWDYVDTKELAKAVYDLIRCSADKLLSIPTDPKNV